MEKFHDGHLPFGPGGPPGGPPRMLNLMNPHWLDARRRLGLMAWKGPSGPSIGSHHQLSSFSQSVFLLRSTTSISTLERERLERLGIPKSMGMQMQNDALTKRHHAERIAIDMSLQLAVGQIPEYAGMDPLLHPGSGAFARAPTLIPPRDALGYHPYILRRPYPPGPELAHRMSAYEQLAASTTNAYGPRTLLPLTSPGVQGSPHPSFLAQQKEYLRYINMMSQFI